MLQSTLESGRGKGQTAGLRGEGSRRFKLDAVSRAACAPLGESPLPRLSPFVPPVFSRHKATQTCRINFSASVRVARGLSAQGVGHLFCQHHPYLHLLLCGRGNVTALTGVGEGSGRELRGGRLSPPRTTTPSGHRVRAPPAATSPGAPQPGQGKRRPRTARAPDKLSRARGARRGCRVQQRPGAEAGRARRAGRGREEEGKPPRPGNGGRPTSAPRARRPEPASFSAAAPPGRAELRTGQRPRSAARALPLSAPRSRRASGSRRRLQARAALAPGPKWRGSGTPGRAAAAFPCRLSRRHSAAASAAAAAACRIEPGVRDGPGRRAGGRRAGRSMRSVLRAASAARAGGREGGREGAAAALGAQESEGGKRRPGRARAGAREGGAERASANADPDPGLALPIAPPRRSFARGRPPGCCSSGRARRRRGRTPAAGLAVPWPDCPKPAGSQPGPPLFVLRQGLSV